MESNLPLTFAAEVKAIPGGEHLEMCYSCGTCVSKCKIGRAHV
jgi:heterodisulfide reductase subunit C